MADGPLLVIAAGGTGGHMFPAQALAEAMIRKGWRVRLSTDARGARYAGGFPHVVEVRQVASATFARGGVLARAEPRPDASRQAHFAAGDELAVVDRWPGWLMVEGPEGVGVWVPEGALFALDR